MRKIKVLEYKIVGIKCDNPNCTYENKDVCFKDYKKWLNKPCPLCGSNLLTQNDFNTVRTLVKIVKIINFLTRPFMFLSTGEKVTGTVEMNGTGKVKFKIDK